MNNLKADLPETTQGAFQLGRQNHIDGHTIDYNPWRNMDNRINHLWAAWIRGWKSQDLPESPEQISSNE